MINFDENLEDFGCGLEEETSMSKNGAAFLKAYARTCTVFNHIKEAGSEEEKKEVISKYLTFCYETEEGKIKGGKNAIKMVVNGPSFESITRPNLPDIAEDSISTLYLVEFFTHCCINCIHSIEDVRQVHEEIEAFSLTLKASVNGFRGLKVVSIHSPKFPREKDSTSIKDFCKRMRMEHSEVINDPECNLWNEFGVTCWPTLLILGPNPNGSGPNLLFNFMGEDHKEDLLLVIKSALQYFQDKLVIDHEHLSSGKNDVSSVDSVDSGEGRNTFLRFPGKVAVSNDFVVVSDSGNNRLVVLNLDGQVIEIIGGAGKGYRDGSFSEALFYNPQGIAIEEELSVYVADTGNHSIRKIDMKTRKVSTLIEPGHTLQVNNESVTLKSPWDLNFYDPDTLLIAGAGNHQLFAYFFNDKQLFGVQHEKLSLAVVAGSGREENRNNSYIMKASFAQPSGICTIAEANGDKSIYIADSESSSIRTINSKGQVAGVVGASRDPTDLFAFGDVDGKGLNVRLQHPMGVCGGVTSTEIFIADTYNHKIKKIDAVKKECQTFISTELNEPSGICIDSANEFLYVADTNNHSIKIIEVRTGQMKEMAIVQRNISCSVVTEKIDKYYELPINEDTNNICLSLKISPLPDAYEGGQWKITSTQHLVPTTIRGSVEMNEDKLSGRVSFDIGNISESVSYLVIALDIFFCRATSCLKRTRKMKISFHKSAEVKLADEKEGTLLEWENMTWE